MEANLRAIEVAGSIDREHRLHIDEPLPLAGPSRVRVIILYPESGDIDEADWLHSAAANPAFSFLKESAEDVYSMTDGKPFHD